MQIDEQVARNFDALLRPFLEEKRNGAGSVDETFSIPIHMYIVAEDDGTLPNRSTNSPYEDEDVIVDYFKSNLESINQEFHKNIKFYICEVDVLECSEAMMIQTPGFIASKLFEKYPDEKNDNAINLFINNDEFGVGEFPEGIKIPSGLVGVTEFVMHELGHYFGLYHTDEFTIKRIDGINELALFPDHTPVPDVISDETILLCEGIDPGECYGDRVGDTPVEYLGTDCGNQVLETGCLTTCSAIISGQTYIYRPDFTNVMSRFSVFDTRMSFSTGQRERMYDVLTSNTGSHPFSQEADMEFLIDDNEPSCLYNTSPSTRKPSIGRIDIVGGKDETGEIVEFPFPYGKVINKRGFSGGVYRLGKGLFETDFFSFQSSSLGDLVPNTSTSFRYIMRPNDLFDCTDVTLNGDFYDHLDAKSELSILDIVQTRRHILGIEYFSIPHQYLAADVNYDQDIDVKDLVSMLRVMLDRQNSYNDVFNWLMVPVSLHADDTNFVEAFNNNPFLAKTVFLGEELGYSPNENGNTYFGQSSLGRPNVESLDIPEDNPIVLEGNKYKYHAVKYGNVNMSYGDFISSGTNGNIKEENINIFENALEGMDEEINFFEVGLNQDVKELAGVHMKISLDPNSKYTFLSSEPVFRADYYGDIHDFNIKDKSIEIAWVAGDGGGNLSELASIFRVKISSFSDNSSIDHDFEKITTSGSIVYKEEQLKSGGKVVGGSRFELKKYEVDFASNWEALKFYPNPVSRDLFVEIDEDEIFSKFVDVRIFDVAGIQTSAKLKIENGRINIPNLIIERFKPGVLFFQISNSFGLSKSGRVLKH